MFGGGREQQTSGASAAESESERKRESEIMFAETTRARVAVMSGVCAADIFILPAGILTYGTHYSLIRRNCIYAHVNGHPLQSLQLSRGP